jgi:hypothetical protein
MEHHGCQQEADTFRSTINGACETTCLAREMEVEIQSEKVVKDIPGNSANSLLGDTGKDCITQFLEDSGSNAGRAIYRILLEAFISAGSRVVLTSYDHGACYGVCRSTEGGEINVHGVDNVLKVERNLHIKNLESNIVNSQGKK